MNDTIEKIDLQIQDDLLTQLKHQPTVKVVNLGALLKNGTVTLK